MKSSKTIASVLLVIFLVSGSGCILESDGTIQDSDGDGVQDKYDACPSIAGDPSNQGCPSNSTIPPSSTTPSPTTIQDSDGDGVQDSYDACPYIPGDASNNGCPLPETEPPEDIVDTDGDGVQDKYDACPSIAGDPTNQGCPLPETEPPEEVVDTDGDGVIDSFDACPEIAGDPSNNGCPSEEGPEDTSIPPWTFTMVPTFTISPSLLYIQWLGEWESDMSEFGISNIWIVMDDDGQVDMHVFINTIIFTFYLGHFNPTMQSGDFVGTLEYNNRTETFTFSLDAGVITATRLMDYGDGVTYEQTTELTKKGSIALTDSNYIESYGGYWFKIGDPGRIKSIYILQTEPNMVRVSIWGNCTPTPCDWGIHDLYYSPSQPISFEFQDGSYARRFEIFLGTDGELEIKWEFEHSDGAISTGTEEFFKWIPI